MAGSTMHGDKYGMDIRQVSDGTYEVSGGRYDIDEDTPYSRATAGYSIVGIRPEDTLWAMMLDADGGIMGIIVQDTASRAGEEEYRERYEEECDE